MNAKARKMMTFFNEDGQSKIGGFERCLRILISKQEIFRLKVPMHDPHKMTSMNHVDNLSKYRSSFTLRVTTLCSDAIKECTTQTQLHHQMHVLSILVSNLELDDVGLSREVLKDENLPLGIINMFFFT